MQTIKWCAQLEFPGFYQKMKSRWGQILSNSKKIKRGKSLNSSATQRSKKVQETETTRKRQENPRQIPPRPPPQINKSPLLTNFSLKLVLGLGFWSLASLKSPHSILFLLFLSCRRRTLINLNDNCDLDQVAQRWEMQFRPRSSGAWPISSMRSGRSLLSRCDFYFYFFHFLLRFFEGLSVWGFIVVLECSLKG